MNLTTLASFFTILAFYIAWFAFYIERLMRLQQKKEEKIDILKSVSQELGLMNVWLGESYDDTNYPLLQDPWHPFHMVYGLGRNDAIKNAISLKSVSLVSSELLETLVTLNQKLGSFEQHVNRLIQFNTANPIIATKAFYYYDSKFSKYTRTRRWLEFEKIGRRLYAGKKLLPEEIYLIGSMRLLKDLHVQGIGSEADSRYLRHTFVVANQLVAQELGNIDQERQFKQHSVLIFLDRLVLGSFIFGLYLLTQITMKGGEITLNVNNNVSLIILVILIASIILGWIKFGYLETNGWKWQQKFAEIWNDSVNFFLAGLIGYFFLIVRLPRLLTGEGLNISDFVLFILFVLGIFGHLCVMSKNITDGVEAILKRVLERR